jgi:hypothetical protein
MPRTKKTAETTPLDPQKELESVKKELAELKQIAEEQKMALLETQRSVSDFMIVSTVSTLNLGIDDFEVQNKLGVIANTYRVQIRNSTNPFEIFQKFYADCVDLANQQGIEAK